MSKCDVANSLVTLSNAYYAECVKNEQLVTQIDSLNVKIAKLNELLRSHQDVYMLVEQATEKAMSNDYDSENYLHSIRVVAKALNLDGMGERSLYSFLCERGVLIKKSDPIYSGERGGYLEYDVKQTYIKRKYFKPKFNKKFNYYSVGVTAKGMAWILGLLRKDPRYSKQIVISDTEWMSKCDEILNNEEE